MQDFALSNFIWFSPLLLTLKVAVLATIVAMLIGVPTAFFMARKNFPGSRLLDAIMTLPMVLPPTVLGYYLIVLIGRKGFLGPWLESLGIQLIFTWQGAVVAASIVAYPLIYKSARAGFASTDGKLEQAARTLGASELRVFLQVSLPLAWRSVMAGTMLAFARSMGEFGATLMVAGNLPGRTQTLSMAIYSAVEAGRDDTALFLVVLTSLVCLSILVGSGALLRQ